MSNDFGQTPIPNTNPKKITNQIQETSTRKLDTNIDIQDVQKNVLNLLNEVGTLINNIKHTFQGDKSLEKYNSFAQDINKAVQNVQELELRMAVIAPMKAGKSTIINAVVGDDLLPSRNAAMTTIPTEIIFDKNIDEATLILDDDIKKIFTDSYLILRAEITRLKTENGLTEKMGQYPHLQELIEEINSLTQNQLPDFLNAVKIKGKENISKVLTSLNDIVRVISVLSPEQDPIEKLETVPRILTPYWSSENGDNSAQNYGNLVVVDTPGPNEAGDNLKLTYVVEQELRKSSIILIVLDFTQLNNQAADEVKRQVQPIINLRGKENLYVLINKIDQRRNGDMTTEDVKQFVYNDLSLTQSNHGEKIFEISAIKAFSATKFLLELQQFADVELENMNTVSSLAQECLGNRWEQKLAKSTKEEMEEEAQCLWEDSGFKPFLEQAISALIESAAPKCLKSALNITLNHLISLGDDIKLRGSAILKDEEKLRLEIGALEADLTRLESCRLKLKKVDDIRTNLEQQLEKILEDLKKRAKVSINTFYEQKEYEDANFLDKAKKDLEKYFKNVLRWSNQRSNLENQSQLLEFSSQNEADKFANQAFSFAKERTEYLLTDIRRQVEQIIQNKRNELADSVEKEAQPIIEKAKQRLNENFEVNLELPTPSLSGVSLNDNSANFTRKNTRIEDGGSRMETYTVRSFWHWLWILPETKTRKVKNPDKRIDYYTVSLTELSEEFNQSLSLSIQSIKDDITKYLDKDFKQRIDNYFQALDDYLANYTDNLRKAENDQYLSLTQKQELIDKLNIIVPDVDQKIEISQTLIEQIN